MESKAIFWLFITILASTLLVWGIYYDKPIENATYIYSSHDVSIYNTQFNYCSSTNVCMDPKLRMDCMGFKELK